MVSFPLPVLFCCHTKQRLTADGEKSRWRGNGEGGRRGWMCVFEHPQWQRQVEGGGEVWEECRGQGPLLPHPALLFCLLFSVFYSSVLRLGVSAPVRASCSLGEERGLFVFMTVSRPLRVEMFNHGPAARHKETSPYSPPPPAPAAEV